MSRAVRRISLLVGGRASLTAKRAVNVLFRTAGDRFASAAAVVSGGAIAPLDERGDEVAYCGGALR